MLWPKKTELKIFLFIFLSIFCLKNLNASSPSEVILNANHISYAQHKKKVIASGNVLIKYKGYDIKTDTLNFSFEDKKIYIPNNFIINKPLQNIDAKNFYYDFNLYKGTACSINSKIERLIIKGNKLYFHPDKLILEDASFTTCDLDHPHFKVEADQFYIYPQWGFFVAFNNLIKAGFLPFPIWVPTYIYGSTAYGFVSANAPIPDIGSSKKEGLYVKHKFGYYVNEKSSGTIDVGLTDKLGYLVGNSHSFMLAPKQFLNFRVHYYEKDDFEGQIKYFLNIIKKQKIVNDQNNIFENMFSTFTLTNNLSQTNLAITLQHRELEVDSRVSYLPKVKLEILNYNILDSINVDLTSKIAKVKEESSTGNFFEANMLNLDANLSKETRLTDSLKMDISVFSSDYLYSENQNWHRLFGTLAFSLENTFLNPKISFSKKLYRSGKSPFEYQSKYAIQTDEIGIQLHQNLKKLELALVADYSLENQDFRNFDLTATFPFHCWKGSLTWKSVQGFIQFGFNIF